MRLGRNAGLALATAAALALSGCGDTTTTPTATDTTSLAAATTDVDDPASTGLTLVDGWAKAVEEVTEDGMGSMTGVFGTLTNSTDDDIHLTGGSSPAASMVELHDRHERRHDGHAGSRRWLRGARRRNLRPRTRGEPRHAPRPHRTGPRRLRHRGRAHWGGGTEVTLVVAARAFAGAEETYAPGEDEAPMTSTATSTS